jgi:hypothetical protein
VAQPSPIARIVPAIARRSRRAAVVASAGPTMALAGLAWAFVQPWRITFLHPYGKGGFWYLLAEPPLLVIAVGLLFHAFVALPLLRDLEEAEG